MLLNRCSSEQKHSESRTFVLRTLLTLLLLLACRTVCADIFGSGENQFEIEFVTIGDPGNPADLVSNPSRAGAVAYSYRMGKYEISRDMVTKANALGDLGITLDSMDFVTGGPRPEMPATRVNWLEAAQFVNWLNTSNGFTPAYKFSGGAFELWAPEDEGYNPDNLFRNSQAVYFLPSADEWYKAAYYDPVAQVYYDYPTGSDTTPNLVASGTSPNSAVFGSPLSQGPADITSAGGLSPYGTMAQGGNVEEWEEARFELFNSSGFRGIGLRGGGWNSSHSFMRNSLRGSGGLTFGNSVQGFRVASIVPEPTSLLLLETSMLVFFCKRNRGVVRGRRVTL